MPPGGRTDAMRDRRGGGRPVRLTLSALCMMILLAAAHGCAKAPPVEGPGERPPEVGGVPFPEGRVLMPVSWGDVGLARDDMDLEGLKQAVERSLEKLGKKRPDAVLPFGKKTISAGRLAAALALLSRILGEEGRTPEERADLIREAFVPCQSRGSDGRGAVLFTGYYEPVLPARRERGEGYSYPVYARPDDLLTIDLRLFPLARATTRICGREENGRIVPYYTRARIDGEGALAGRGLELLWFDNPVDVFFLQVQGSGRVRLPSGETLHVLFDGKNGHPYRSIGRYLIDEGYLREEDMSLQEIKDFLAENPDLLRPVLDYNASYVFFRLAEEGPFGSTGVVLTAGRSIATDSSLFPPGAPALIRTERPLFDEEGEVAGWRSFARFVVNQDTGGAIKGPDRVDLFWGAGEEAGRDAGYMKQNGELYILLPKEMIPE